MWHSVLIPTEEQNVTVSPTEGFDGIIIETREIDGTPSPKLYLNEEEMECLILQMRAIMEHVKNKK